MTIPDFETMWGTLAPVGRATSGGYLRQPFTTAEREARAWFVEECLRRDLRLEEDGFGNAVAWWDVEPGSRSGQPDQKAVLTGRTSTRSARAAPSTAPWAWCQRSLRWTGFASGDCGRSVPWGSPSSARRRGRASRWPAWARGSPSAPCRGPRRVTCATATAWRTATWCPAPVTAPTCWPGSVSSSSCTSSRAATSCTGTRRSASRRASGRTVATASTSAVGPTTPGPPRWRTAATP